MSCCHLAQERMLTENLPSCAKMMARVACSNMQLHSTTALMPMLHAWAFS